MQTTFFNASGAVLFVRDDMETGEWVQEEYTVNATFPLDKTKMITRGQMISFVDTATGNPEFFEIRNVTNVHADAYQQIIAEHIAVSELSDDHINTKEITDNTPAQALAAVLTGTLWSVGNASVTDVQSVDISRGSVWQAVGAIAQNWNCYIVPRVTTGTTGNITGRYLDIIPATGTFRGLRLSMEKNIDDPSVVIDDTEVYTALYGYGGTVDVPQTGGAEDEREELTFADVVWTATDDHPAKPADQTYLEDPAATALYGRNGRPRYGYYQNSDIKDAEVLLEKTWEALKKAREPKISITGTVFDYFRFGCPDVPVRLHDIAIIEFTDTGEIYEKQIIKNRVDLIDQTGTTPEIGDYIPNIVYINRETAEKSGGGGGGGSHGQTNKEHADGEWYQEWKNDSEGIGMVVGQYNGGWKVKAGQIVLAINDDGGTTAKIEADTIDIDGVVEKLEAYELTVEVINAQDGESVFLSIDVAETVRCETVDALDVDATNVSATTLEVGGDSATWKTYTARFCGLSAERYFLVSAASGNLTPNATVTARGVVSYTDTTLHYLGSDGASE